MALGYYIPCFLSYVASDLHLRHKALWVWHLFPVWVSVGQMVFRSTLFTSTIQIDRLHNLKRDLPAIRITIFTLAALSASIWLYNIFSALTSSSFSLYQLFIPSGQDLNTYIGAIRDFLIWDYLFFVGSSILWVLYQFCDLKQARMVETGWFILLGLVGLVVACAGPGAATALGWLWREDLIATKRHKDAVVKSW